MQWAMKPEVWVRIPASVLVKPDQKNGVWIKKPFSVFILDLTIKKKCSKKFPKLSFFLVSFFFERVINSVGFFRNFFVLLGFEVKTSLLW